MKSMTGFGRSSSRDFGRENGAPSERKQSAKPKLELGRKSAREVSTPSPDIEVSVRAVNGRFLELRMHLPREYAAIESDFKAILQSKFNRGTLDVYVNRSTSTSTQIPRVVVNKNFAKELMAGYRELKKALKLKSDVTLETLARMHQLVQVEDSSELTDTETKLAKDLVAAAANACNRERVREGQALQAELMRLCGELEKISVEFEELKSQAQAELERRYRDRIGEAIQRLGLGHAPDDQRIAQEVVMQLDRSDITEELTRLREHIKAYRALLQSAEPQGKKLDFYAQELLREVNTIGSKSHIARLTSLVVDAKTIVEKIREQIQNAE